MLVPTPKMIKSCGRLLKVIVVVAKHKMTETSCQQTSSPRRWRPKRSRQSSIGERTRGRQGLTYRIGHQRLVRRKHRNSKDTTSSSRQSSQALPSGTRLPIRSTRLWVSWCSCRTRENPTFRWETARMKRLQLCQS